MITKTVKLGVTVTPEVIAGLSKYATSHRTSCSAVARQAITEFLLRNELISDAKDAEVLAWSKEFMSRQSESVREAYKKKRREVLAKARAAKKL